MNKDEILNRTVTVSLTVDQATSTVAILAALQQSLKAAGAEMKEIEDLCELMHNAILNTVSSQEIIFITLESIKDALLKRTSSEASDDSWPEIISDKEH